MTNAEKALQLHKEWNGKFETTPKMSITTREDLALAYTPGVAEPCKVIAKDKEAAISTLSSLTLSLLYLTEVLYLDLVISVLMPLCLLWKEKLFFSKNLVTLTLYLSALIHRTLKKSSKQ